MKKKHLVIIAILLIIICAAYIAIMGRSITAALDLCVYGDIDPKAITITAEKGGIAEVTDVTSDGMYLYVTFRALQRG